MAKLVLKKKIAAKPATTYPEWVFDGSPIADPFGYGERAVKFLRALKHPKNPLPGNAFQLDPWQERIVRAIYGPRHEDGTRIVRTVVMLLPRGNRKTSLAAALALLHVFGPERQPGGEVLSAASDRKQAKIAFKEALSIIRAMPRIEEISKVADSSLHTITNAKHGSFYESISSDAGTQHGRTPVFALVDELHAWKKRDLWDAVRSGMPKTKGSLMVIATTAGRGQDNLAFDQIEYARRVAKGEINDPATLPILFETPANADWQDELVWHQANPGLAYGYPDLEGLRQLAREAKERPSDRDAFKQYHLNFWLDYSEAPFVDMDIYDEGKAPFDLFDLEGEPCWLGVDMSISRDLTAIVAAWRDGNDGYIVHPWFFCPGDSLTRKAEMDGVPYPFWAEEGFLEPTPGAVIDHRRVADVIREICNRFNVREVLFDPNRASMIMSDLLEEGLPVVKFDQSWRLMAPAADILYHSIVGRKFQHGGHPVLRWNFANIVTARDRNDNIGFHKGNSKDRIDGAVASAMAVSRASTGEDARSIYDTDERPDGFVVFEG